LELEYLLLIVGINADDNAYSITADFLSYINNDYIFVDILTNAAADLTLLEAKASMSLIDYIN